MSLFPRRKSFGRSPSALSQGAHRAAAAEVLEQRRLLSVGPDASGYMAEAAPFQAIDLDPSDPAVRSMLTNDAGNTVRLDLGANTFRFYNKTYSGASDLWVSTNGLITLGGPSSSYYNSDLSYEPWYATVAPLWDEWSTYNNADDQVLARFDNTDADPEPDRLVVEWNVVEHIYGYGSGESVTFQAILQLNTGDTPGEIVFNYPDLDAANYYGNGADATAGIKGEGQDYINRLLVWYYGPVTDAPPVGTGRAVRLHSIGNEPPVANPGPYAGESYTVAQGLQMYVNALRTTDREQQVYTLTFEWDFDGDGRFGEEWWDGAANGRELGYEAYFESNQLPVGPHTIWLRVTDGGGQSTTVSTTVTITPNQSPVANAGPVIGEFYNVVAGRAVTLDGSLTHDPDGELDFMAYEWDVDNDGVYGEGYWDTPYGDERGQFTLFNAAGLQTGDTHTVSLHVTDSMGNQDYDDAVIHVVPNRGPVADAGPAFGGNYQVAAGKLLYLDANGSGDPDEGLDPWSSFQWDLDNDGIYGETWFNGGTPERGDEWTPSPQFISYPTDPVGATFPVSVKVTDSEGLSDIDSALVEVIPNRPPHADAGPLNPNTIYTTYIGGQVYLNGGNSTDPEDGYIYSAEWDLDNDGVFGEGWLSGGNPENGDEGGQDVVLDTYNLGGPRSYTVKLRVYDIDGAYDEDEATVYIADGPWGRITNPVTTGVEGAMLAFDGQADFYSGIAPYTYDWTVTKDGQPYLKTDGQLLRFTPEDQGSYHVSLHFADAYGNENFPTPLTELDVVVANAAPQVVDSSITPAAEGGEVTLSGTYIDYGAADGHTLTVNWGDGTTEQFDLGVIGAGGHPLSRPSTYNGHTYYAVLGGQLGWDDAEAVARRVGGHLVTINDAPENAFVTEFVRDHYRGDVFAWIGLTDHEEEGHFHWVSGDPAAYRNWGGGEPNNALVDPDGEDYAMINWPGPGLWNDLPRTGTGGFRVSAAVVELDGPPVADTGGPRFDVRHRYGDDGDFTVSFGMTDSDGAAAPGEFGWTHWTDGPGANDHYYRLTDGVLTFEQAEAQAVSLGGHLVSVNSANEQGFIEGNYLAGELPSPTYWIGFTDADDYSSEGHFVWTSGEPVTYTNWYRPTREPNDAGFNEDFTALNFFTGNSDGFGFWNDIGSHTSPQRYTGLMEFTNPPGGARSGHELSVHVTNVDPVITAASTSAGEIGGASAGQQVTLSASFTDAGFLDVHGATIDWGDGSTTAGVVNESGGAGSVTGGHAYAQAGIYAVNLVVSDGDGGTATRSLTAYVSGSTLSGGVLLVVGTAGDDKINVKKLTDGGLSVERNAAVVKRLSPAEAANVTKVILYLGAGNDSATVPGVSNASVFMDGGAGNDQLNGGNGPNVLLGGDGNDTLLGGSGRDLLVGGAGADQLSGNAGDDILVAGTTAYDADRGALEAIRAAWLADQPFANRVAALTAGVGTGGTVKLGAGTVFDDAATDILTGSAGSDWFLLAAGGNTITDLATADRVTAV